MSDLKNIFEATPNNVLQLLTLSRRAYYIPAYQREYNWDARKAESLINNFFRGIKKLKDDDNNKAFTFLGAIISIDDKGSINPLPENKNDLPSEIHHIIDGQQRLTTLIIIIKALDLLIKEEIENSKEKIDEYNYFPEVKELMQITREILAAFRKSLIYQIESRKSISFESTEYHNYPKVIRAYTDCWSQGQDESYTSEISRFILYKIDEGISLNNECHIYNIFKVIKNIIVNYNDSEFDILSTDKDKGLNYQKINDVFDIDQNVNFQTDVIVNNFKPLFKYVFFSKYILNKVCVTYVTVKDNKNAFDIFEALNTTGDALTAFETFKPLVIEYVGISNYEKSESKSIIDDIQKYFDSVKKQSKLKITKQTTSWLALCYGVKITDDISEHRTFLKTNYNSKNNDSNMIFLKKYKSLVNCHDCFLMEKKIKSELLNRSQCQDVKVLLYYLKTCGFELTIPIISNLIDALDNGIINEERYNKLIKSLTAFSFIYRSAHKDSSGIDNAFRVIIKESFNITDYSNFETLLLSLLYDKFAINISGDNNLFDLLYDSYINKALCLDHYALKAVSRFIIICSINDAEICDKLGILVDGVTGSYNSLSMHNFEKLNTIEHIAPTNQNKWNSINNPENLNKIGNLTLLPSKTNASISNKCWKEKRACYEILCEKSKKGKDKLIKDYRDNYNKKISTIDLEVYQPQVSSLCVSDSDWTDDVIKERTINTYQRAFEFLISWLK